MTNLNYLKNHILMTNIILCFVYLYSYSSLKIIHICNKYGYGFFAYGLVRNIEISHAQTSLQSFQSPHLIEAD